jgi:hypothetical protein
LIGELLLVASVCSAICVPPRDAHGRIARSRQAITEFRRTNPCPATGTTTKSCHGYVIDHIVPLKRCGDDAPHNMQWQTIEQAREKDRWE